MTNQREKLLSGGAQIPGPPNFPALPSGPGPTVPVPQRPQQPPAKIIICVPSGRTWEARTSACIGGIMTFTAMHGHSVGLMNLETSMITKGRNDIVEQVIRGGFDYAMWIDSDMVLPPPTILRLLSHKKDIVGATYNKRVAPYETLGRLKGTQPPGPLKGLYEAEQMPGGCMLVKADVYKKLGWPWYWETYSWPGENGVDALKNYLRHNFSKHAPEELLAELDDIPIAKWLNDTHAEEVKNNWQYYSEDLNFIRKAIKGGYRVWCDMDLTYETVHLGTLEVTCKQPEAPSAIIDAVM